MQDSLTDGRAIRLFNVIDDHNREALTIEVDAITSSKSDTQFKPAYRVPRQAEPTRCDNGPEYISNNLKDWVTKQGIVIEYIDPGPSRKRLC